MGLRIFNAIETSASGLRGQRARLQVIAENLANSEVTKSEDGLPYRRKTVVMESAANEERKLLSQPYGSDQFAQLLRTHSRHLEAKSPMRELRLPLGSTVSVQEDLSRQPFRTLYEPGHPDADEQGYVLMPNVNPIEEMVDLITATRAYEANVSAIQAAKDMFLEALEI